MKIECTIAEKNRILSVIEDNDPFQCIFDQCNVIATSSVSCMECIESKIEWIITTEKEQL